MIITDNTYKINGKIEFAKAVFKCIINLPPEIYTDEFRKYIKNNNQPKQKLKIAS